MQDFITDLNPAFLCQGNAEKKEGKNAQNHGIPDRQAALVQPFSGQLRRTQIGQDALHHAEGIAGMGTAVKEPADIDDGKCPQNTEKISSRL